MHEADAGSRRGYWAEVARVTWRAFRRVAPWILGAIAVRAIMLGSADLLSLGVVGLFSVALVAACTAYALVRSVRSSGLWAAAAWMVGGAVGLDAFWAFGVVFFPGDPYGGDQALLADPLFWGFWSVAGAITGYAYWRIAAGIVGPSSVTLQDHADQP